MRKILSKEFKKFRFDGFQGDLLTYCKSSVFEKLLKKVNYFSSDLYISLFNSSMSTNVKKSWLSKMNRICLLTGRARSVYKAVGNISRFKFAELANFGFLPGYRNGW